MGYLLPFIKDVFGGNVDFVNPVSQEAADLWYEDVIEPGMKNIGIDNPDLLFDALDDTIYDIGESAYDAYKDAGGGLIGAANAVKEVTLDNTLDTSIAVAAELIEGIEPDMDLIEDIREDVVEDVLSQVSDAYDEAGGGLDGFGAATKELLIDIPSQGYDQAIKITTDYDNTMDTFNKEGTVNPAKLDKIYTDRAADEADKISADNKRKELEGIYRLWNYQQQRDAYEDRKARMQQIKDALEKREKSNTFQYDLMGD